MPTAAPAVKKGRAGFTLVELLVSMAVMLIIMMVIFEATDMAFKMSKRVNGDVVAFQDASITFANLTRNLSTATLNTYYDIYPDQTVTTPQAAKGYIRQSSLHFVISRVGAANGTPNGGGSSWNTSSEYNPTFGVFFQAPLGYTLTKGSSSTPDYSNLNHILNACGYYIQFGSGRAYLAQPILKILPESDAGVNRYRFRLMQFIQPSEDLSVHATSARNNPFAWYTNPIAQDSQTSPVVVRPAADNIIALILTPKMTSIDAANTISAGGQITSTDYTYDSRDVTGVANDTAVQNAATGGLTQSVQQNQLPPVIRVTMVAIDEPSAITLQAKFGSTPPTPALVNPDLFTTYDPANESGTYIKDLNTLIKNLSEYTPKLNFRVFTAEVAIRGAKWNTQGNK